MLVDYQLKFTIYIRFTLPILHGKGFDKCMMTCFYGHSVKDRSFTALNIPSPLHPSVFPFNLSGTTDLFTISIFLPFPDCLIVGIIHYVAFSDWLLLLGNIHLNFLYIFHFLHSPLFIIESYSIFCMFHSWCIHLLTDISVASKFWQFRIKLQVCVWSQIFNPFD